MRYDAAAATDARSRMTRPRFITIALPLAAVAVVATAPSSSDWDIYQTIGRRLVVLDCHDVHCYRVLVAPILEHLPGPSLLKWKTYAVLASAAAAIATGQLCVALGLSTRAAALATWIAAFGFGPLQAILDPYTSDPLMYLLAPLLLMQLLRGRIARAGVMGSIGVLAKEFAAAPLWIFAAWAALGRRWRLAARAALAAAAATLVWLALQAALQALFNDSYGSNPSANLLGGGWLVVWLRTLGPLRAIGSLFLTFGPLFIAFAAGLRLADRSLRLLVVSALPALAAFGYVQQPDRALWNFAFIVIPIAVPVVARLRDSWCGAFVVAFAAANLRLGEHAPEWFVWVRAAAMLCAIGIVVAALFASPREATVDRPSAIAAADPPASRRLAALLAVEIAVFAAVVLLLADRRMHQRDPGFGVNQWGYRDEARAEKEPVEMRVAVVGGSAAYEAGVAVKYTFAGRLLFELRDAGAPRRQAWSVVNLAEPQAGADAYVPIVREYAFLQPDMVCVFDGYDALAGLPPHARERSRAFRAFGYLPILPARILGGPGWMSDPDRGLMPLLRDGPGDPADLSCAGAASAYCSAMRDTVRFALSRTRAVIVVSPPSPSRRHAEQQRSLAAALASEFGSERRFAYVDGSSAVDLSNRTLSIDGVHRTDAANHELAARAAAALMARR